MGIGSTSITAYLEVLVELKQWKFRVYGVKINILVRDNDGLQAERLRNRGSIHGSVGTGYGTRPAAH
jgi:hypothetical protein